MSKYRIRTGMGCFNDLVYTAERLHQGLLWTSWKTIDHTYSEERALEIIENYKKTKALDGKIINVE